MIKKMPTLLIILLGCLFSSVASAWATTSYPLYLGGSVGWGSTNWTGLVDKDGFNDGSDMDLPVAARDRGTVWGLLGGVEISPHFALQGEYQHYPTALLNFDENSNYIPVAWQGWVAGILVNSDTVAYNAVAKFMVPIWHTGIRAFSDLGPSYTYRKDYLAHIGHWGATFGAGLNYNIFKWLMIEENFNYTTGWDTANTTPVKSYLPFLYSVNTVLVFRFNV